MCLNKKKHVIFQTIAAIFFNFAAYFLILLWTVLTVCYILNVSLHLDASSSKSTKRGAEEEEPLRIAARHFEAAFHAVVPSVSKKDQAHYDKIRNRLARARTRRLTEGPEAEEEEPKSTMS